MSLRPFFRRCPRCGEHGYEKLKTYSHCVSCLYVKDFKLEREVAKERRQKRTKEKREKEKRETLLRKQQIKEKIFCMTVKERT